VQLLGTQGFCQKRHLHPLLQRYGLSNRITAIYSCRYLPEKI